MMLHALYDLAKSRGLLDDPDYEKKKLDYLLRIDARGRFVDLTPTKGESGRSDEILVPRMPKRTVKVLPGFLYDNAQYVLGLGDEGATKGRNAKCVQAFRALIDDAADQTKDEGALAASSFYAQLDQELPRILKRLPAAEWTGSEWVTLILDSDAEPLFMRPAIREYWGKIREGGEKTPEEPVRCLVTGKLAAPARMHDSIKRVPNAQTAGAALVSFNAEAFTSQGLEQGENAPVSREAAEGYVTAINWLLEGTGSRRFQYGVPLGNDAVVVFWTREKSSVPDALLDIFAPTPEMMARSAVDYAEAALKKGLEPGELDDTPFYAATLSGNAARVVVRDWLETTASDVMRNVRRYFDDLRLGHAEGAPLPIYILLRSVEAPGGRGIAPDLASRLFGAALRGTPFPRELLGAALRRLRLPPDKVNEARLLRARCSLIKATLLRLPKSGGPRVEVGVSLDESNQSKPYLLGRLFAVLERLQGEAQGSINATIRDRYFGAASSTPALVFPRLLRLSVHHAAKAGGSGWLEKLKGQIIGTMPAEPFPRTMGLEEQGLFAIGYYHQRERFFEGRKDAADKTDASDVASSDA